MRISRRKKVPVPRFMPRVQALEDRSLPSVLAPAALMSATPISRFSDASIVSRAAIETGAAVRVRRDTATAVSLNSGVALSFAGASVNIAALAAGSGLDSAASLADGTGRDGDGVYPGREPGHERDGMHGDHERGPIAAPIRSNLERVSAAPISGLAPNVSTPVAVETPSTTPVAVAMAARMVAFVATAPNAVDELAPAAVSDTHEESQVVERLSVPIDPDVAPHGADLLPDLLMIDRTSLETALRGFLEHFQAGASEIFTTPDILSHLPWIWTAVVGAAAGELLRRRIDTQAPLSPSALTRRRSSGLRYRARKDDA
jgi:hypothetical protein